MPRKIRVVLQNTHNFLLETRDGVSRSFNDVGNSIAAESDQLQSEKTEYLEN
jgi:hypothetical protein